MGLAGVLYLPGEPAREVARADIEDAGKILLRQLQFLLDPLQRLIPTLEDFGHIGTLENSIICVLTFVKTKSWGPRRDIAGTEFGLKRRIKPVSLLLPDPGNASLGVRLRYLRKKLGLSLDDLSEKSGLHRNILSRLERNKGRKANHPWVLGRILPFLAGRFKEAFPEAKGDPYDFFIPPKSFGSWLKNLRLRRGMRLRDLAATLGVKPFTIIRYEADLSKPDQAVRARLRKTFKLNGELDRFLPG